MHIKLFFLRSHSMPRMHKTQITSSVNLSFKKCVLIQLDLYFTSVLNMTAREAKGGWGQGFTALS